MGPLWMDGIFANTHELFPSPWASKDGTQAVWCDGVSVVWGLAEGFEAPPCDARQARHVEGFLLQRRTTRGVLPRVELVEKLRALPAETSVLVGPRAYDPKRVLHVVERFTDDVVEVSTASSGHVFPTLSLVVTCGDKGLFLHPLDGEDGAVELLPAPPVREPQTHGERKAHMALTYLYDRARRDDPGLREIIGSGSQIRYLCAQALAEITGRPLEDVEADLDLPLVPRHHDPISRLAKAEFEIECWRERAEEAGEDQALEAVRASVEAWRKDKERTYREQQRKAGVL